MIVGDKCRIWKITQTNRGFLGYPTDPMASSNQYLDQSWKNWVPQVCRTATDKTSWSANNIAAMRSADF